VFERFRQGDASTTRKHGGLGLGLSIVKHLIEQHGGTVRVDSEGEERGASFTIELPAASRQTHLTRADRPLYLAPSPPTSDMTLRDLRGLDVLVVDDEADARELINRILSDCHASVRMASSAEQALASIRDKIPQVIVSDLGMPDVDGFELMARIRALGTEYARLPAVALTAFARSEDRLRALEAGFRAHISKPVEPSELIATVASMAGKS
jgi:CheY-like chemotaxis protein